MVNHYCHADWQLYDSKPKVRSKLPHELQASKGNHQRTTSLQTTLLASLACVTTSGDAAATSPTPGPEETILEIFHCILALCSRQRPRKKQDTRTTYGILLAGNTWISIVRCLVIEDHKSTASGGVDSRKLFDYTIRAQSLSIPREKPKRERSSRVSFLRKLEIPCRSSSSKRTSG